MFRIPTILVVLGVTGDLAAKKIVPAVFHMLREGNLPEQFRLLGVSRRDWRGDEFKDHIRGILTAHVPHAAPRDVEKFLKIISYHQLEFGRGDDYRALGDTLTRMKMASGAPMNTLFYLSVPPQFYGTIFDNLHATRLVSPGGVGPRGWTRIIVEKPFGSDEKSAKALDAKLAKLFKEEQIYRIDHYLAKEAFQNVLVFRFFNNLFENQWGTALIESIHARQLETVGIEERGDSYDGVGALRDVGQNHLLQMVALAAMDQPKAMRADAIRAARAAFLRKLKPLSPSDVKHETFRAQYDGYRAAEGVAPDSETETYFRVAFGVTGRRWRGVVFTMEAGKRVADPVREGRTTEIEIVFRHPKLCFCQSSLAKGRGGRGSGLLGGHYKNSLVFRADPKEGITLKFWVKKSGLPAVVSAKEGLPADSPSVMPRAGAEEGLPTELEERTFEFEMRGGGGRSRASADYEKLLSDCVTGDQTLFVSSKEIAAMWRFIDPIIAGWRKGAVPLRRYMPDHSAVVREAEIAMDRTIKK